MNDQQEPAPDQPDTQPPADTPPTKPPAGLGESTPVRAASSAVAFAATCLIVATVAGAAAIAVEIIRDVPGVAGGGFVQDAVVTGFQTLMRCWLAGLVAVVMTNSFLGGDRRVVVRRSGILGAVSGLLAIGILAIGLTLLEGWDLAPKIVDAMPYIVAAVVLLICLSWRSGEGRSSGDDDDQRSAEDADEDDDKDDGPDGSKE